MEAGVMPTAREGHVVVIMGSTGVGKSKLAVELALKLGTGEVVNMDSMQVYEGLDIATNKPTEEEKKGVPHHLFGFVPCHEKSFTVTKFVSLALDVIDDIHRRRGVPILVGGTNYYIYSLLWADALMEPQANAQEENISQAEATMEPPADDSSYHLGGSPSAAQETENTVVHGSGGAGGALRDRVLRGLEEVTGIVWSGDHIERYRFDVSLAFKADSESELPMKAWRLLQSVDQLSANKLHPKDYRKVLGRLFFVMEHGRAHSSAVLEKKATCRFQNACLLWLDGSMEELTERINARVDLMLERGLLQELMDTCQTLLRVERTGRSSSDPPPSVLDFHSGLLQAIGGKEFTEYIGMALQCVGDGSGSIRGYREGDETLREVMAGATRLKQRTRRYAVSQRKWVLNKIAARHPVHAIPVSDFLNGNGVTSDLLVEPGSGQKDSGTELLQWKKHKCDVCQKTMNGQLEWESHLKSRRHRATVKKRNRRARDSAKQGNQ